MSELNIRAQREARGWSQAELAKRAGTTQQTVDRLESGKTRHSRAAANVVAALLNPNSENEATMFARADIDVLATGARFALAILRDCTREAHLRAALADQVLAHALASAVKARA